ncbi:hypothetical protein EVJ58_g7878 [Rhodofomes roseus]|uniref:Checkpoint protein n=1 Tax=Rhodofomes roseus TaxID=34475 RepID=A0A4Y9Y2P4_9APHY|nr:hypothetical protein EVJ58_g7878 [Rhodofomes roseus]
MASSRRKKRPVSSAAAKPRANRKRSKHVGPGEEQEQDIALPARPRLPVELILLIYEHIHSQHWLAVASRICRALQHEFERLLYRNVFVRRLPEAVCLYYTLTESPIRADFVHSLEIVDQGQLEPAMPQINEMLLLLKNLKTLTLYMPSHNPALYSTLIRTASTCTFHLKTLECHDSADEEFVHFLRRQTDLVSLRVKVGPSSPSPNSGCTIPPDALPRLTHLQCYNTFLLRGIGSPSALTHLWLTLHDEDVPYLGMALGAVRQQLISLNKVLRSSHGRVAYTRPWAEAFLGTYSTQRRFYYVDENRDDPDAAFAVRFTISVDGGVSEDKMDVLDVPNWDEVLTCRLILDARQGKAMRFRANIEHVNTFYKISQAVEKLQKRCIIKFTESEMHIICNNEAGEGGIQARRQIKVSSLFTDYRIQSNANNEIYLGLPTEAMTSALKSAAPPSGQQAAFSADAEVVMKCVPVSDCPPASSERAAVLRLCNVPVLFEDADAGRQAHEEERRCGSDLRDRDDDADGPVRPDRARRPDRGAQAARREPDQGANVSRARGPSPPSLWPRRTDRSIPKVHILLPPLAKLRTVVERMRPLAADVIGIRANLSGCLQLCAQTDNARVDVSWNGLSNPKMAQDPSTQDPDNLEARDPTTLYGVLVSLKSLQKFLSSHVVSTTTIACICQNHCIILYVYIGEMAEAGGVLTFYIPAIIE